MNLLIDIGNSRLKWTVAEQGNWQAVAAIDYRRVDLPQQLLSQWQRLPPPHQVLVSCVASLEIKQQVIDLAQQLWPEIELVIPIANAHALGVTNAYANPQQLGIDRWLAILAAHHYYPGDNCLVDAGTALTLDLVSSQGQHLGGLIIPGLQLMKCALVNNTAALTIELAQPTLAIANHTQTAIDNGSLYAAVGFIEGVLGRQDRSFQVIVTGGDGGTLAKYLPSNSVYDSDLVFKGLNLYEKL